MHTVADNERICVKCHKFSFAFFIHRNLCFMHVKGVSKATSIKLPGINFDFLLDFHK